MEHYICVNDIFGYCSHQPRIRPKPSNQNPGEPYLQSGGKCTRNPLKCGLFITNTQKCLDNPHKTNSKPPQV